MRCEQNYKYAMLTHHHMLHNILDIHSTVQRIVVPSRFLRLTMFVLVDLQRTKKICVKKIMCRCLQPNAFTLSYYGAVEFCPWMCACLCVDMLYAYQGNCNVLYCSMRYAEVGDPLKFISYFRYLIFLPYLWFFCLSQ